MQKLNSIEVLNNNILLLENRRAEEWAIVKEQIHFIHESIRPVNLIKSAFTEVSSSPEIKHSVIDGAIGMTTGYITKKAISVISKNPIVNILGTLLQIAVTNIATKHADDIKAKGTTILKTFFSKHKNDSVI